MAALTGHEQAFDPLIESGSGRGYLPFDGLANS